MLFLNFNQLQAERALGFYSDRHRSVTDLRPNSAPQTTSVSSRRPRCWLAGGGIKGGIVHGSTDELGILAVEERHYVTDIHATALHLIGLDSHKLEVPGRKRLEIDFGTPILKIID